MSAGSIRFNLDEMLAYATGDARDDESDAELVTVALPKLIAVVREAVVMAADGSVNDRVEATRRLSVALLPFLPERKRRARS